VAQNNIHIAPIWYQNHWSVDIGLTGVALCIDGMCYLFFLKDAVWRTAFTPWWCSRGTSWNW